MPDKPARYIGGHMVDLGDTKHHNIDGTRKQEKHLEYGDTIMLPAEEIYGKTLLHDPHQQKPSLYLGLGKVVLPEHANLTDEERALLGYEHHLGRSDFIPLEPLADSVPAPEPEPQAVAFVVPSERVAEVPDKPKTGRK